MMDTKEYTWHIRKKIVEKFDMELSYQTLSILASAVQSYVNENKTIQLQT